MRNAGVSTLCPLADHSDTFTNGSMPATVEPPAHRWHFDRWNVKVSAMSYNKFLTPILGAVLAAASLMVAAAPSQTESQGGTTSWKQQSEQGPTHLWMHPRLGLVRVDAEGRMLPSPRAVEASAKSAVAGQGRTYLWLHPRLGFVRVDAATGRMLPGGPAARPAKPSQVPGSALADPSENLLG